MPVLAGCVPWQWCGQHILQGSGDPWGRRYRLELPIFAGSGLGAEGQGFPGNQGSPC